ncbi:hypothetical protein [Streptomyces sp. NBC_00576]|uniref:hypothetical protein n=1 Tax=Streptomyces sp. NBC_00576 TaxID=2903665 RepID=UPI002E80E885|nr:hypothetical protein [Streptomyces sp. NBC_00576]WUB68852.1 hypothetical protein OG734_01400 [Streptomyces sp. NBC_00576]
MAAWETSALLRRPSLDLPAPEQRIDPESWQLLSRLDSEDATGEIYRYAVVGHGPNRIPARPDKQNINFQQASWHRFLVPLEQFGEEVGEVRLFPLPGTHMDTPGASHRGLLSNDLPLPLPHARATSKPTDIQKHADPLLTSELKRSEPAARAVDAPPTGPCRSLPGENIR